MNTTKIMNLPESIRDDIADFNCGLLSYKGKRLSVIRVTMCRLLTDDEKAALKRKRCINVDSTCYLASAPEIKKSVFYVRQ